MEKDLIKRGKKYYSTQFFLLRKKKGKKPDPSKNQVYDLFENAC